MPIFFLDYAATDGKEAPIWLVQYIAIQNVLYLCWGEWQGRYGVLVLKLEIVVSPSQIIHRQFNIIFNNFETTFTFSSAYESIVFVLHVGLNV